MRTAARAVILPATAWLLVATSAPYVPPQSCVHPTETIMAAVSGDCGPAGMIVLESLENECAISVRGAPAVGLPNAGRFADFAGEKKVGLLTNAWALSGDIGFSDGEDAGAGADAARSVDAAAPPEAGSASDAGDGSTARDLSDAAGDAAPYLAPPDASSSPPHPRRYCTAQVAPNAPLRLVCNDGTDAGAACTASLTPL